MGETFTSEKQKVNNFTRTLPEGGLAEEDLRSTSHHRVSLLNLTTSGDCGI
jgi:hypothetical protein